MPGPSQEVLEAFAEKLSLPIALLGAAGMAVVVVGVVLAMLLLGTPGPAGTTEGPDMYLRHAP